MRSRARGDRLGPLGLGGSKKLQDIFVDAKVPRGQRDRVPIVEDQGGIVWVVGHCLSERNKLTDLTRRVLALSAILDAEKG